MLLSQQRQVDGPLKCNHPWGVDNSKHLSHVPRKDVPAAYATSGEYQYDVDMIAFLTNSDILISQHMIGLYTGINKWGPLNRLQIVLH